MAKVAFGNAARATRRVAARRGSGARHPLATTFGSSSRRSVAPENSRTAAPIKAPPNSPPVSTVGLGRGGAGRVGAGSRDRDRAEQLAPVRGQAGRGEGLVERGYR